RSARKGEKRKKKESEEEKTFILHYAQGFIVAPVRRDSPRGHANKVSKPRGGVGHLRGGITTRVLLVL
ncbi:MAG: hypothetical protein COV91_01805, partial [Candidatus Taylorbacteria bacterium CG11_big_fil_rev_8_21_14_0_20_46_11]